MRNLYDTNSNNQLSIRRKFADHGRFFDHGWTRPYHRIRQSVEKPYLNLQGLLTKFITFSTIICAAALDKIAPTVGVTLPINVALIWTALLIIYEIGSILENAHEFGLKITWLQKWLRVFERDVGETPDKDDQENNAR